MLSALIVLPILGSLLLFLGLGGRKLAVALAGILLGISLLLFANFDLQAEGLQWVQRWDWIPAIGLSYSLGLDGFSLLMVALNGLLTLIAVLTAEPEVKRPNLLYGCILFMSGVGQRGFCCPEPAFVLLVLRAGADPDLPAHLHLGQPQAGLCCHQVFDLHRRFRHLSVGGLFGHLLAGGSP
jgi:NADH:ubiquinone oxidoreductase subunit 4 (subunit M)